MFQAVLDIYIYSVAEASLVAYNAVHLLYIGHLALCSLGLLLVLTMPLNPKIGMPDFDKEVRRYCDDGSRISTPAGTSPSHGRLRDLGPMDDHRLAQHHHRSRSHWRSRGQGHSAHRNRRSLSSSHEEVRPVVVSARRTSSVRTDDLRAGPEDLSLSASCWLILETLL